MQLPETRRLDAVAEGLELLVENVAALDKEIDLLFGAGGRRGVSALAGLADEEAAKVLILLDLVRMDPKDGKRMARQIRHFYDHLARCIYAEMAEMRPATFREARTIIEGMRPALYLDGPNDVDWIFRNRLIADREERLYVDYVRDEEGARWVSPTMRDEMLFGEPTSGVRRLVGSLGRLGCTSREGLEILADAWKGQRLEDATHWQEARAINEAIVGELIKRGMAAPDATAEERRAAVDTWPFPLGGLDLRIVPVTEAELEIERERGEARTTGVYPASELALDAVS